MNKEKLEIILNALSSGEHADLVADMQKAVIDILEAILEE